LPLDEVRTRRPRKTTRHLIDIRRTLRSMKAGGAIIDLISWARWKEPPIVACSISGLNERIHGYFCNFLHAVTDARNASPHFFGTRLTNVTR
jgi:uncharacterized protein with von Willebrand factor type A (vWA) domain